MHIRDIRRLYNIYDILKADRKKVIVCPLPGHIHKNYTPSFSIFTGSDGVQRFHCFGCGRQGDVIDLVGYLSVPGYDPKNPDDVKRAIALLTNGTIEYSLPVKEKRAEFSMSKTVLTEQVLSYAKSRGLTEETLIHFGVGELEDYKGFMAIPIVEFGSPIGCKLRNMGDGKIRYMSLPGSRSGIFNHDNITTSKTIYIVKGEIAAMFLWQHGYNVCAPSGGEGMKVADYNYLWRGKVVVVGDNDPPGRKLATRRASEIGARLIFPPEGFKDIDEYIVKTNDFKILEDKDESVHNVVQNQ